MATSVSPARRWLLALGIAALTVASMAAGLGGELLNWDDNRFVGDNPLVQTVSWTNLKQIFARPHQEAYHPLHLTSYLLDTTLYGQWAPGFKIHNLLLYLLGLLLLHRLLLRLALSKSAAACGVLLFALHPLHVEAVVWVSARKEPLSLCFMLGAALLYFASVERSWRDYRRWMALLLFGCALLTKTSTLVLPLLLLAMEVLSLKRKPLQSLLAVAPMLLLAAGVSLYVFGLWQENEMLRPRPTGATGGLALVLKSVGHHSAKLFLPLSLSPVYPIDRAGTFNIVTAFGGLAIGVLGFVVWRIRNAHARLAAAWFLLSLLPVANIMPIYFFVQDRYAFIPSVAVAIAVAAIYQHLAQDKLVKPMMVVVLVLAVALALLTARQATVWRSNESLWTHAATVQPDSYYAHLALGHTLRKQGEPEQALKHYRQAVTLQPRFPAARIALCLADSDRRRPTSTDTVEQLLRQMWMSPDGLTLLSGKWVREGQLACASLAESRAFELRPPDDRARIGAASRWTLAGNGAVALRHLGRVQLGDLDVKLESAYHEVRAQGLLLVGERAEADRALQRSLKLTPRTGERLRQAAVQLRQMGRTKLAAFYKRWAAKVE